MADEDCQIKSMNIVKMVELVENMVKMGKNDQKIRRENVQFVENRKWHYRRRKVQKFESRKEIRSQYRRLDQIRMNASRQQYSDKKVKSSIFDDSFIRKKKNTAMVRCSKRNNEKREFFGSTIIGQANRQFSSMLNSFRIFWRLFSSVVSTIIFGCVRRLISSISAIIFEWISTIIFEWVSTIILFRRLFPMISTIIFENTMVSTITVED